MLATSFWAASFVSTSLTAARKAASSGPPVFEEMKTCSPAACGKASW
jgi:hypothetical protein